MSEFGRLAVENKLVLLDWKGCAKGDSMCARCYSEGESFGIDAFTRSPHSTALSISPSNDLIVYI
jgi:hypothetical protein